MCCNSPPPPDYTPLANASKEAAEVMAGLGNRQLAFAERQYNEMLPLAQQVAQAQLAAQQQQMEQGKEYYDYLKGTFRPLEQGLVADAQKFSTEGYREQLARQAAAAAGQAFGTTQQMAARSAASRGISPMSGAGMALERQGLLGLSAQRANAMTGARQQAEAMGFARKMDAASLGRNLPGASTGAYQAATGAGSAGVASAMAPGGQYMTGLSQGAGTIGQGLGMQIGGLGNILGSQTSVYNTAQQQPSALGTIAGMGLGAFAGGYGSARGISLGGSDIRLKQDIVRVGTHERTGLPMYEFSYKEAPKDRYRGVMAHEVEVLYPKAVVTMPTGYKAVNYGMLGIPFERV